MWGGESKERRRNSPHFFVSINVCFSPLRMQMCPQQLARDRYLAEIAQSLGEGSQKIATPRGVGDTPGEMAWCEPEDTP